MPKVCLVIDKPSFSAQREGRLLTGYDQNFVYEKAAKCGLLPSDLHICQLSNLDMNSFAPVTVTMGEQPLQILTGKKSIWKWHLSPLDDTSGQCKVLPTFDFTQMNKDYPLRLYFEMTLRRAAIHATPGPWVRKEERYVIGPDPDEAIARFEDMQRRAEWLSIDIETGRGQINTFGCADNGSDAIAAKVLPGGMPPSAFHKLWSCIRTLCESDVPKIMQNGIYERTYLSRYGIAINAFKHDTMTAQKFLWPELSKGLDNVGRIYTLEPYWKDDGRVSESEGKQKDWGNIRDWSRHFIYNCRDTSNTFIAAMAQRKDLENHGMLSLYDNYVAKLFDCVDEMGTHGLPLDCAKQADLINVYEAKSQGAVRRLSKPDINPRSPKQKLALLKAKGYKIPTKRKADGSRGESTDELSLKRLRLEHPDDTDLQLLLEIAGLEKALSSYLRVTTLPDKRIRFMLDCHGTETGRMSCSLDPWGGGFNAQTMGDDTKTMIAWPADSDRVFMEFDLEQAETRFVAYDAIETNLLGMIERREDIHKYVAAEIFQKAMADVTHDERQLGKKSGHGANYAMGVATFQDSCLKEMDLVLDKKMATRVLESYHKLFPGLRKWHANIRSTVYRERRLTNPFGRVRYFYGRCDDNTYREAYAYRPQSTVPDIANTLMLKLKDQRTEGAMDFWLHMQTHDSITLSCKKDQVERIARYGLTVANWHPEIILPAGRLVIPTSCKVGPCLGTMQKFKI